MADQCGFARTVRANQRMDLARRHLQIKMIDSDHATKMLVEIPDLQHQSAVFGCKRPLMILRVAVSGISSITSRRSGSFSFVILFSSR